MDRRFLTVLALSLVFALVVSGIFYQMTTRAATGKPTNQATRDIVVSKGSLGVGVSIKPDHVKIAKIPADQFPKGGFSRVDEVVDRAVMSNILPEEPLLEGRLAARGSGLGLAPIIPVGMRAVSVRVNDVVGVAGFVLPGMRVDVLVTGRPPSSDDTITSTVLQNILVLSAGQTIQADTTGQAINAPNVTLLVSPEQAEILTLAGNEGRIQLVLRNGGDQEVEVTPGRTISQLYGRRGNRASEDGPSRPHVPKPSAPPTPRVVENVPPPPDEVIVIRGTARTVEVVNPRGKEK
ncbi:MAG: Flp pilus assembly protein CpaB [Bryobacteraceae bacterium]|nr:Flp pilus assembly protein CpaB [Bryobacterales bacterium]MEB2359699.1 Flp pilus assembly protein CpaB [Bryobacterales bacterium]NUN00705.1 Flp pilus assembly protein CpaB [Bryobacteraceae bacterium]